MGDVVAKSEGNAGTLSDTLAIAGRIIDILVVSGAAGLAKPGVCIFDCELIQRAVGNTAPGE